MKRKLLCNEISQRDLKIINNCLDFPSVTAKDKNDINFFIREYVQGDDGLVGALVLAERS